MAGNIKGITIELNGDATGLTDALKKVDKETKGIQSELKQVDNLLKFDPSNVELLSQKQKLLGDAIQSTSTRLDALKQAQSQVEEQFRNGEIGEEAYRKFQREIIATENKLKAFQQQADSVRVRIEAQADVTGIDKMRQSLEELGKKANEVGDKMKDVGAEMSAKLTAPIASAGTAALLAAGQFDNAAGQIQAALGVTADEAKNLEGTAREVWKAGFGESLEEVSSGLVRVKQNMKQIDDSEIEGVTKSALSLAKAFDSDVNEVTRAGNNLMTNFGISAEEAFDMMASGAQNGLNFSNEMFDNLAEYAPLFSDLGFSAEEMFGTLISGTEEGVYNLDYLNDMVKEFGIRLMDGSEKTQKAMSGIFSPEGFSDFANNLKKYGKESSEYMEVVAIMGEDYTDNIIESMRKGGLEGGKAWESLEFNMGRGREIIDGITEGSISGQEAMKEIAQALLQIEDPVAQTALGVELFGTKFEDLGTDASLAMLSAGKSLEDFEGAMNGVIEAQEETFGQRWDNLTRSAASSLEPVGMILLNLAEEWLPKVVTVIESIANWFSNLSPVIQTIIMIFGALIAALGPFLLIVGNIISVIGTLIPIFTTVFTTIAGVISGPVVAIVAAVTAVITIIVLLAIKSEEIGAFVTNIWNTVSESVSVAFTHIKDFIVSTWETISTSTSTICTAISSFISDTWETIKTGITTVVTNIFNTVKTKFTEIQTSVQTVMNAVKKFLSDTWDAIKTTITTLVTNIFNTIKTKFTEIQTNVQNIMNAVKKFLSDTWDAIITSITQIVTNIFNTIRDKFNEIKTTITNVMNEVKKFISDTWETIKTTVSNAVTAIYNAVKDKFEELKNAVSNGMNAVKKAISDIWNEVENFFKNINLFDIGASIMSGLLGGITSMMGSLMDTAAGIANSIKDTIAGALDINSPSRVMIGFGKNIGEGLVIGMDNMVDRVAASSMQLADAVSTVHASMASSMHKASAVAAIGTSSTTVHSDRSKTFSPTIHITTVEDPSRAAERMLKRLAYQL